MKIALLALPFLLCVSQAAESEFQKLYKEQHSPSKQESPQQTIENHEKGTEEVASEQDELSADVQELIQGETNDKVISFLAEAEELMNESIDKLEALDTSGMTIAVSTEIVEKIYDAAKEKQKSSGSGEGDQGALMEMMKQMMGQGDQGKKPGDKPGQGPGGSSGGDGQEADSSTANQQNTGESDGKKEARRLPRKAGSSGTSLPREFNKVLDAYNKALTNSN